MSKRKVAALLDDALLSADTEVSSEACETVVIRNSDAVLQQRLATFKISWFNKPDEVGAVECAVRGWANRGVDELECGDCGARLKWPFATECLRRNHLNTKCIEKPEPKYAFPSCSSNQLALAAQNRFTLLLAMKDHIPLIENPQDVASILAAFKSSPESAIDPHYTSACVNLSLFGWEPLTSDASKPCLKCHLCNRQVNISKYSRVNSETVGNSSTPTKTLRFDPLEEHRWYCPWIFIQPSDQELADEPGWKQTQDALHDVLEAEASGESRGFSTPGLKRKKFAIASSASSQKEKNGERDFSDVQAARASFKDLFKDLL
ncbi:hypothetical protein HDU98_003385 [Podochytrium sp. JEL0797]|nr:hypothetical protein HDU98_003385 [Podochytrium sp. JEL0797]